MIQSDIWEIAASGVGFGVAAAELETIVMCISVKLDREILLKERKSPYKSSAFPP